MQTQKVWDIPIRICHWGLVLIITFQYLSAEILDDNWISNIMQWHFYAGYTCIGLIIFRLCWGIFGTYYAKFSQFVVSPLTTVKYLRNRHSFSEFLGHNPAGAYSVIVLLTLVLTQAISGLFISDEIFSDGPYFGVLSDSAQSIANFLHHNVITILFWFIALHVIAILYYKFALKQGLTSAMISGTKQTSQIQENNHGESHQSFPWIGLLISLLITALAMYLIIEVLPPPPSDDFYGY
ncbi:MAG: cytochrome b [Patiriisocius sp.]|mgnify:CR=1 FL=1|jgi:cytochrome b